MKTGKVSPIEERSIAPTKRLEIELGKTSIKKEFPGFGIFEGVVTSRRVQSSCVVWVITYPDGDTEELDSAQLKDILLANMDGKTPINENIGEDLEPHDFAARNSRKVLKQWNMLLRMSQQNQFKFTTQW